ncbi:hypothetical protein N9850_00525 [Granulosicoccus sp.]|nr:hypothetical protein [Granulosicoccus sp.]MDB4222227.1 hypothetical protein [Granulosicoccus sp.]
MQFAILIPLFVGFGASALVTLYQTPATAMPVSSPVVEDVVYYDPVFNIENYDDDDYGFSVAIPVGWSKVVAAETLEDFEVLEPGYAIGFEAPNEGGDDLFADYIMIEILPGTDSGAFETDGSNRLNVSIDSRPAWIDQLSVNAGIYGLDDVDLTVYQAQISGLGFTVGLYAIGEPGREETMAAAFELMVRTFSFFIEPYSTA